MAPSSPTFTPRTVVFNNQHTASVDFSSSDGVLQTQDLEEAEIYLNGVQVQYDTVTDPIDGIYYVFITGDSGNVSFEAFSDPDGSESATITKTLNITKVIFDGVSYNPA